MRALASLLPLLFAVSAAARPTASEVLQNTLAGNHYAMSGAKVQVTVVLVDHRGSKSTLVFKGVSRKWKGHLTKALAQFSAPPDLAGAGFLQIQHDDRDDDRFIYLPSLKRSRRVAASQRSASFMGTDYNFADLDRRDWRTGKTVMGKDTVIGKYPCYHITITPTREDSPYSRIELDVRQDIWVPLRIELYDHAKVLYKVLEVLQLRRIAGQWFMSKSRMKNLRDQHATTMSLEKIDPTAVIPDAYFTVQRLEH